LRRFILQLFHMTHYLITGGAGFIGSNLVRTLLQTEPEISITCIDDFDPFYAKEIKLMNIHEASLDRRFRLLDIDLGQTSVAELEAAIQEPVDVIIHLAAKAGVRPSIQHPLAYQQVNVLGLQHLLDYAKKTNIRQFVFGSSSSVYGLNDHFPWREDDRLLPISPYAMTKLAGEMLGHVYSRLFGVRFIALRFFTVYGPAQRPDLAIHKFTRAILRDEPIPVFGDGHTSRDYTYVADIVSGIVAASRYIQSPYEIINLGNNYAVSLSELISSLESILGKKALIERLPEQAGDVPKTFADISKARQLLGYEPATRLKEGLHQFYEWFTNHRDLLLS
jgi:UDP-glucuronate 4-epimerase